MTRSQKIQKRQSEIREAMATILDMETRQDADNEKLKTLQLELRQSETDLQAALSVEGQPTVTETRTETTEVDAEEKERLELRSKCRVGNFISAALEGRTVAGPEAEYAQACKLDGPGIPMDLWQAPERRDNGQDRETRALTPAPSTVGINMGTVQPFIFAPSIASRLGIEIRQVPSGTFALPVITTAPSTAAPKAKGGAADATAGVVGVKMATPKRIPAQLTLSVEDVAAVGTASFETALRQALQMKLSDSLDNQIINGNGTAPNLSGLLHQLTDPSANPSDVVTWTSASETLAAFVDGLWSMSLKELAVICGVGTYQKLASTFQVPMTSGANGEMSAASYLMNQLASFSTNKRMPVEETSGTFNKSQTAIVARMGQPGITRAVVPNWGRLVIDDVYSDAPSGQRHLVIAAIVGDLMLVQADAYAQTYFRLTT